MSSLLVKGVAYGPRMMVMMLRVTQLQIDPTYQRDPSKGNLDKIGGDDFNPNAIGVLRVCRRKKTKVYYVVDGQHRLAVLKEKVANGEHDGLVLCLVLLDTTREEEADLFVLLNTNKPVSGNIRFRARLVCKYNPESRIKEIVEKYGFELMFLKAGNPRGVTTINPNGFSGEGVMLKAFNDYGEGNFIMAIRIIKECFGSQHLARQGRFVCGLCNFLSTQSVSEHDLGQICKRLKGVQVENGIKLAEEESKYSSAKYVRIGKWLADVCGLRRAAA